MSAGRAVAQHVLAAGSAGGALYAFKRWRPALPWDAEVRKRRAAAKWRRKVFSFGKKGKHRHQDTGR